MKTFTWKEFSEKHTDFFESGCAVTVGSFDGPHKGHETLFNEVLSFAENHKVLSGILTFVHALPGLKHPVDYPGDIATLNQRLSEYDKRGFDFVILVEFNRNFASLKGEDFFSLLKNRANLKCIVEGSDFRCGHKGLFGVKEITAFCFANGIEAHFMNLVQESSQRVSSSSIRKLVVEGDFAGVERLLGRPFVLELNAVLEDGKAAVEKRLVHQVMPECGTFKVTAQDGNELNLEITKDYLYFRGMSVSSLIISCISFKV